MTAPDDDVEAGYGLIAESVEVPTDKSWVAFKSAQANRDGMMANRSPSTTSSSPSIP
jgi:hypothetical protein